MKRLMFVVSAICFVLLISQGQSFAITALSYSTADWPQFQITGSITFTDQYSIAIAEAEEDYVFNPQARNDIRSWGIVSSENTATNTRGYSFTSAALLYTEGRARADGVQTIESFGAGYISRSGYFDVFSTTTLNFSIPYAFHHDLLYETASDSGYGYSWINLWLGEVLGPGQSQTLASKAISSQHLGSTYIWDENGVLTFDAGIIVGPGKYVFDIGLLASASANTASTIPEPTSMLLMGMGLLGAGVFKRKRFC